MKTHGLTGFGKQVTDFGLYNKRGQGVDGELYNI